MSEDNENTHDVAAALEAGIAIAKIEDRTNFHDDTTGIPYVLVPKDMRLEVPKAAIELSDARAATPRARMGTAQHDELDSFIAHVNRFKDNASAIFADIQAVRLTAVLDYHPSGPSGARWGRHRSVYRCPLSRPWQRWLAQNEKPFTQDAFGEFIDQNLADISNPNAAGGVSDDVAQPAALVEMARNLIVRTKGEFSRHVNVTTGEASLISKLENESTSTKIPRAFVLGIPVFEGGTLYAVEARVRFAMREGKPSFAYSLYQHEKVLKDAFGEVRAKVAADTSLPVFAGSPES